MSNPWHHALSSAKKWGGVPEDTLPIHRWFDESKGHHGDFRHRALRHHTEGIFLMESIFGPTLTLSTCTRCGLLESSVLHNESHPLVDEEGTGAHHFVAKVIPTRWVGEQHVIEDLGRIPAATEWLSCIRSEPWMNRSRRLSRELEEEAVALSGD